MLKVFWRSSLVVHYEPAPVLKGTVTQVQLRWPRPKRSHERVWGATVRILPAELRGSNYVTQEHVKWWRQTPAQAVIVVNKREVYVYMLFSCLSPTHSKSLSVQCSITVWDSGVSLHELISSRTYQDFLHQTNRKQRLSTNMMDSKIVVQKATVCVTTWNTDRTKLDKLPRVWATFCYHCSWMTFYTTMHWRLI